MSNQRIQMLLEWIKADKNDPFLPYALALEYKKLGEIESGLQLLQSLIQQFPNYLPAYYQLGITHEENGNNQAAAEIYKKGLALAREQKDQKTAGEINEALLRLDLE